MIPDFQPASTRLVVFDFDGVILESANIKTEAFPELFSDYPQHQAAIRSYHLAHQGISRFKKFEWIYRELLRQPLDEDESRDLGARFTQLVLDRILVAPFVPGALELIRFLKGRIPAAIASGTPQGELEGIVSARGISDCFVEVAGTPRTKPEILQALMTRFGMEPSEVLMIGDANTDFDAAVAVGCAFFARQTDGSAAEWDRLGVTGAPDLRPLLTRFTEAWSK